jgi:hypothetical protein
MDNRLMKLRNQKLISILGQALRPFFRFFFQLKVELREELVMRPTLYISNHNIGALIESHSVLFLAEEKFKNDHHIYGFTHPSIFRVPIVKNYFEWLGAVPATYEVAREVFKSGHSILIFPGGNKQALRSLWDYKKNSFRESHGWAKIAIENQVDVVPITFKGSHFVNPVLFQSSLLSKLLIIPWLLGLKWLSVSLAQLMISILLLIFLLSLKISLIIIIPIVIMAFCLSSLTAILPYPIQMIVHKRISINELSQNDLEEKVGDIMDRIYES